MPFPTPNLDDRSFEELVASAIRKAGEKCPQWTDRSPGDPMVALLEASAFLTDLLIYRVNRMPDKAYAAFLNLIGARIGPPSAAAVTVEFKRKEATRGAFEIPAGARIKASGADLTFVLTETVKFAAEQASATGRALHCAVVEGERLGVSTGAAGQVFRLKRAPVIAETGDGLDLIVGVEAAPADKLVAARSREYEGKAYHLWREVESFSESNPGEHVFTCDRNEGVIGFAPAIDQGQVADGALRAALAAAPPAGREIRAWYRCGGGAAGNVAAHVLTGFDGADYGVDVDNPVRAAGGRDAESLQSALRRGPHALRTMETLVTASDFERAALATRVAARARAFAVLTTWRHGEPGTVEVQIVPYVDEEMPAEQRALASTIEAHQTPALLQTVNRTVAGRTPLGVKVKTSWARVRPISIDLKTVCFREEDEGAVEARLKKAVHETISPFAGRGFGQPLRASDIHELVAREPGVRYVERLKFHVDAAPKGEAISLCADVFQPRTWHVAAASAVYRSLDDGESWCETLKFESGEKPIACRGHPLTPGLLAAVSRKKDEASVIHISYDCGETWRRNATTLAFRVHDIAWSATVGEPELYLATSKGLYAYAPRSPDPPRRLVVIEDDDQYGFWAVAAAPPIYGAATLAVAAGQRKGVWISTAGAQSNKFRLSGLQGNDVRVLEIQSHGGRAFLWGGFGAETGATGDGAARLELRGAADDPEGWRKLGEGWKGGTCECIAFAGERIFAGSNRSGVLQTATGRLEQGWTTGQIDSGLPLRDEERLLHEVDCIGARVDTGGASVVMTGGPVGVYRSRDGAETFQNAARTEFDDYLPLPEGWLFASGQHRIVVTPEDALTGERT